MSGDLEFAEGMVRQIRVDLRRLGKEMAESRRSLAEYKALIAKLKQRKSEGIR